MQPNEINDILALTGSKDRNKKKRKSVGKRKRSKRSPSTSCHDTSSSSSSSQELMEDTDIEEIPVKNNRKHKGKLRSGLYVKSGDTKLISNEWYAHTALDEAIGGDRQFADLSFNLLVAGELEIICSESIGSKEQFSRLRMLKQLAYKHEFLALKDILVQYVNFMQKIEKGKFKWGSWSDLVNFEHQLMYNISLDRNKQDMTSGEGRGWSRNIKDRKKSAGGLLGKIGKIALCGLRWFKLNVSKYQKDVKLSKRCQMSKNETPRLWRRFTKKLN